MRDIAKEEAGILPMKKSTRILQHVEYVPKRHSSRRIRMDNKVKDCDICGV